MLGTQWAGAFAELRRRLSKLLEVRRNKLGRSFNCALQSSPSWDERAIEAASLLKNYLAAQDERQEPLSLADFGSGNERLRPILAQSLQVPHEYHGYDLRPQSDASIRIDLEQALPPRRFDVVFCLGLLEYLRDLSHFLSRLAGSTEIAIMSYVLFDGSEPLTVRQRRDRGWLSHLTRAEFEVALEHAGFRVIEFTATNRGRTGIWIARSSRLASEKQNLR